MRDTIISYCVLAAIGLAVAFLFHHDRDAVRDEKILELQQRVYRLEETAKISHNYYDNFGNLH